jgi:hypothetical protein
MSSKPGERLALPQLPRSPDATSGVVSASVVVYSVDTSSVAALRRSEFLHAFLILLIPVLLVGCGALFFLAPDIIQRRLPWRRRVSGETQPLALKALGRTGGDGWRAPEAEPESDEEEEEEEEEEMKPMVQNWDGSLAVRGPRRQGGCPACLTRRAAGPHVPASGTD